MSKGKDPQTADGLGGVHKVLEPRPATPVDLGSVDQPGVVEGQRAGFSRSVTDPDQVSRVVHTAPAPVEDARPVDARESALNPARTPKNPFTDARVAPDEASVWTAAKDPGRKAPGR